MGLPDDVVRTLARDAAAQSVAYPTTFPTGDPSPVVGPGGIQVTMIGGSPHPNQAGHAVMADELKETLDGR